MKKLNLLITICFINCANSFDLFDLIGSRASSKRSISKGCRPLEQTQGVKIECRNPATRTRVDCSLDEIPVGVVAILTCFRHYVSSKEKVRRRCDSNGQWTPNVGFQCYPDCGRATKAVIALIVNGTFTSREDWPWHAAIFRFNPDERGFTYVCGASLIHRAAVLTAAHCFLTREHEDKSRYKVVLAPRSSIFEENLLDPHSQVMDISDLHIPASFNPRSLKSDYAIVQLSKRVILNDYIHPVCLPSTSDEDKALSDFQLDNKFGQVVGFGIDETEGLSKKLRLASLPVVSPKDCFEELNEKASDDVYCAGYTNGTSVCNGDSGSGMVFHGGTGVPSRFYVQGIVSYGPKLENSILCNSHSYAVFTRVSFYSEEIQQYVYAIEDTMK